MTTTIKRTIPRTKRKRPFSQTLQATTTFILWISWCLALFGCAQSEPQHDVGDIGLLRQQQQQQQAAQRLPTQDEDCINCSSSSAEYDQPAPAVNAANSNRFRPEYILAPGSVNVLDQSIQRTADIQISKQSAAAPNAPKLFTVNPRINNNLSFARVTHFPSSPYPLTFATAASENDAKQTLPAQLATEIVPELLTELTTSPTIITTETELLSTDVSTDSTILRTEDYASSEELTTNSYETEVNTIATDTVQTDPETIATTDSTTSATVPVTSTLSRSLKAKISQNFNNNRQPQFQPQQPQTKVIPVMLTTTPAPHRPRLKTANADDLQFEEAIAGTKSFAQLASNAKNESNHESGSRSPPTPAPHTTTKRSFLPQLMRWCVVGDEQREALCWKMSQMLKKAGILNIACVRARHVYECIQHIHNNVADATRLNAEQIYVAGKNYGLLPIVHERWPEAGVFTEDTVVIVRKDPTRSRDPYEKGISELKGKKLCLTGTDNQNLQYQTLINCLFPLGYMEVYNGECTDPLPSLSHHFGASCVPGRWSLDADLRKRFENLCKGCFSSCTAKDYYAGPDGAIRCMIEGMGDVAVTNSEALARAELDAEFYQLLCIQSGARKPINSTGCAWMGRPTPAIVVSPKVPKSTRDRWRDAFLKIFLKYRGVDEDWVKYWHKNITLSNNRALKTQGLAIRKDPTPPWLYGFLFSRSNLTSVDDVYYRSTSERYVGEVFVHSMESPFPDLDCGKPVPFKWCVHQPAHYDKCIELAMGLATQRIKPMLACVKARSDEECQRLVNSGAADITMLRADQIITANADDNLVPVAIEQYPDGQATTYMVAAIRKGSNMTLNRLSGSRSCHPGADDVLGWNAPLIILERRGLLQIIDCDFGRAASALFWESCVPEIAKYSGRVQTLSLRESDADIHESLCRMCGGIENCDHTTPFRDYDGALKCLENPQRGGDIAFVTNETLLNGRLHSPQEMANRFELLCLDGTTSSIDDFRNCHWLRVPGRLLVVSARKYPRAKDRRFVTDFIMDIQDLYGRAPDVTRIVSDPSEPDYGGRLNIFATAEDPNSMFSEVTEQLWPIYPDQDIDEVIGEDFAAVYRKLRQCSAAPRPINPLKPLYLLLVLLLIHFLFVCANYY